MRPNKKVSWFIAANKMAAVGLEMVISVGLGALGGWWLDGQLGSSPTFFLVGFSLGAAAAAKGLIRVNKEFQRRLEDERREKAGEAVEDREAPPS